MCQKNIQFIETIVVNKVVFTHTVVNNDVERDIHNEVFVPLVIQRLISFFERYMRHVHVIERRRFTLG